MNTATWEQAVRWFRSQPECAQAVCQNYFDLPVRNAAERYAQSEEFSEVLRLLGIGNGRVVLDLGAGNGIASFAFAKHGWRVTAVEPDPSEEVGAGAIQSLIDETGLNVELMRCRGEEILLPDGSFDAVHARQVFHHAASLEGMVRDTARLLRSEGKLLATREHVVDDDVQLAVFRAAHPLHRWYGGESAYSVSTYLNAFKSAGLRVVRVWGPLESILNFYPGTEVERQRLLRDLGKGSWGKFGVCLERIPCVRRMQIKQVINQDHTPGRLFSFLLEKP
ncbi:MAG: class I SAM-dependent methyltransferase [Nitrospira sp.]|nr:class I SAM-dependent methyltransferase [Nitrospira sp.]